MTNQPILNNRELGISLMFSIVSFTLTLSFCCLMVVIYLFYVDTLCRHYYSNMSDIPNSFLFLILFILHLQKYPLGDLTLFLESKISGFIGVLVESKYILTYSFQSEIHLNRLERCILCSH